MHVGRKKNKQCGFKKCSKKARVRRSTSERLLPTEVMEKIKGLVARGGRVGKKWFPLRKSKG